MNYMRQAMTVFSNYLNVAGKEVANNPNYLLDQATHESHIKLMVNLIIEYEQNDNVTNHLHNQQSAQTNSTLMNILDSLSTSTKSQAKYHQDQTATSRVIVMHQADQSKANKTLTIVN